MGHWFAVCTGQGGAAVALQGLNGGCAELRITVLLPHPLAPGDPGAAEPGCQAHLPRACFSLLSHTLEELWVSSMER